MLKLHISGEPKFGAIHMRLQHCIALADYNQLILVNNFQTEFRSYSYKGILAKECFVTTIIF